MLDLVPEWWAGCTVLDDADAPPWPPWVAAHSYFHEVKAVREELLKRVKAAA